MWDITVESFHAKTDETLKYITDNWDKIPIIRCPADIVDGKVFRFRGMVQDMLNPVFYYATYEVSNNINGATEIRSGKYKDIIECGEDETIMLESPNCTNEQRRPFYCVSIPGLNDWAQTRPDFSPKPFQEASESLPASSEKRNVDDMEVDGNHDTKRQRTFEGLRQVNGNCAEKAHPIPASSNMSCMVHFYEDVTAKFKVVDTLEAVGFAYRNAVAQEDEDECYRRTPRMHVLSYKLLNTSNLLYPPSLRKEDVMNEARALRSELHLVLSQLFLGDHLAADYFICYLLSRVYKRQDCVVLGKLAMNLSNIPASQNSDYAIYIYNVLSKLIPKSHYFAMTLANMNSTVMQPKKDYDTERLEAGMLQLSSQTHLVIDETKLEIGKLEEQGVKNMQALSNIILHQKLNYDFKYYNMEFNTDIPVLIISEGKSLLPNDFRIPLKPDPVCRSSLSETYEAVISYLKEPLLTKLRIYLSVVSMCEYDLPELLIQAIQDEFVRLRQTSDITPDDLHTMLVMARWISLSYGEKSLTKQAWDKVGEMEAERKSRLPK